MNHNNFLTATIFGFLVISGVGAAVHARQALMCTVGVPVVNAYTKIPTKELRRLGVAEPLLAQDACGLDTQILLGDCLKFVKTYKDEQGVSWSGVELLDQPTHREGFWRPKICFVQEQQLCLPVKGWQQNARAIGLLTPVYAKPQTKALQLGVLSIGTPVRVVDASLHGWAKIMLASGVSGYVEVGKIIAEKYSKTLPIQAKRAVVVAAANKFEKTPYRWGGCSGFNGHMNVLTGVDCSGLVYLAYRAAGMRIPRDAHDQYMASFPIKSGKDLLPGDLIFLAKADQEKKVVRVHHVMMVVGHNYLIESTAFGCFSSKDFRALPDAVRKKAGVRIVSSLKHKGLGKPFSEVLHGQVGPDGNFVFLGTLLGDLKTRQRLEKGLV